MNRIQKNFLTVSAALLLGAANFTQADLVPETLLPENTLSVLALKNVQRDFEQFQQSPMGLLLKDPAMQPFVENLDRSIRTPLSELNKLLETKGIKISEYAEYFRGGAALALVPNPRSLQSFNSHYLNEKGAKGHIPFLFLLAETQGDPDRMKASIETLKAQLPELFPNIQIGTQTVGDVEMTTLCFPVQNSDYFNYGGLTNKLGNRVSTQAYTTITEKPEIWFGMKDHLFVATFSFGTPEMDQKIKVIDQDTGKKSSLADAKEVGPDSEEIDTTSKYIIEGYIQTLENEKEDFAFFQQEVRQQLAGIFEGQKEKKTLADSEEFKAQTAITAERDYFFINFSPLANLGKEFFKKLDEDYKAPTDAMEALLSPPRPSVIYESLGLDAFKSIAATWWIDPNGDTRSEVNLICPEAQRQGLSAFINALVTGDCSPLAQTPADVSSFSRFHFDPVSFWTNLDMTSTRAIGGLKGMGIGVIQAFLMKDPSINLQKNVLENLTGDVISWRTQSSLTEEGKISNENVILCGAKDPQALLDTIKAIYSLSTQTQMKETTVSGVTVYSIPLTDQLETNPLQNLFVMPNLSFAVVDGYLLYSTQESGIEQFFSKTRETRFPGRRDVREAAEKIGGLEQCAFAYTDQGAALGTLKEIWDKVVSPQLDTNNDIPPQVKSAIALLPPFELIKQYFGFTVKTVQVTPEGVRIQKCLAFPQTIKELKIEK